MTDTTVPAVAGDFDLAARTARALAASTLVPAAYRGQPANVLVAMEIARRTGMSVMAVMQSMDIIDGRPAWRASYMIGCANATGRFSPLRYVFSGDEGTDDWGCRVTARERASGEEYTGPLVTIGMARAEGWLDRRGSKWRTMPELMLMYRAAALWTRVYCPEVMMGMYTVDEVQDIGTRERASAALHELRERAAMLEPGAAVIREPEPVDPQSEPARLVPVLAGAVAYTRSRRPSGADAEDDTRDALRALVVELAGADEATRAALLDWVDDARVGEQQLQRLRELLLAVRPQRD